MKNIKKLLLLFLAAALMLGMFAGCGKKESAAATTKPSQNGDNTTGTYNVAVQSAGGMAMSGVDVYIYDGENNMQDYGKTDDNGNVYFDMPVRGDYSVVLSGVPKGYKVEETYSFSGTTASIVLDSGVITDGDLSGATLSVGDIMYDFTVTTPAGEKITLSEMLKEKDVVILNYWYVNCSACQLEFPYMQEAYEMYSDKVGIVAVTPFDDSVAVDNYQTGMGLTFNMASCPYGYTTAFGVQNYPTTVVIDRYGTICMVEVGALVSLRYWTSLFEHFTGDSYQQRLLASADELLTQVLPTYEMDTSENIGALINSGDITVTYRPEEGDDAKYAWPFIATQKNGTDCLKASNQEIEDSFAIMYADVTLKAGQAVAFDYLASSERGADFLHVIVDGEAIYSISGVSETEQWKTCYPWVALEDGTYEVALCYIKDSDTNEGDDTVYINNMRVVGVDEIDAATYIPCQAANSEDGFDYTYVDIFFNETDGYYHVGSENGPLLLADLMNYTNFNEELTIWEIAYDGVASAYYEELETYFSFASNSNLNGVCTVNYELGELLKQVAKLAGFNSEDENEWLRICRYYQVYGSDTQLEDPIMGLAPFSSFTALEGKNIETNYFYYDRIIMPRGLLAEFVPSKSGVYRITSRSDSLHGTSGWIFDENRTELYVYEMSERLYNDQLNVSMLYYMEAGKSYYIDIAFWDVAETGYIYYDVEYVAPEMNLFRLASPGYFTYDTNATGDAMYHLVAGGVDVVLGEDGNYYVDMGKDANGNQKYGSLLYADFVGVTALFDTPISTVDSVNANGDPIQVLGMIDKGAFDFGKDEGDMYILGYLKMHDMDVEATDQYLKELWGEEYDANAEIYQLEDVYAGRYHGKGEDYTEEMRTYLNKIITKGGEEVQGCVVVTERLAEILQMLMDKYIFNDVDHSWTKMCYYYEYLGPEA